MTVYAITDTKKGRTGIAPTYLQTTPLALWPCTFRSDPPCESIHCRVSNVRVTCREHLANCALDQMCSVFVFDQMCTFNQLAYMRGISSR